jgi:acetone carboxylase gamma subunit
MIKIVNFTCPDTKRRAAAVAPDMPEPGVRHSSAREVLCPACGWYHLVDIETGTIAADDESAQYRGDRS